MHISRHHHTSGMTIVEMLVVVTVMTIMGIAMIGSSVAWLNQYSIGNTRNTVTTNLETALNRIADDIRRSAGPLASNPVQDPNGPTGGYWATDDHSVLVIAQTPRKTDGDPLYIPPNGVPDAIVYYLKNNTLYRRAIATTYYSGNALVTVTCGATTGGCPGDMVIAKNVTSMGLSFINSSGAAVAAGALSGTATSAVSVRLQLQDQKAGQTITADNTTTVRFRQQVDMSTAAQFASGPGGVAITNETHVYGNLATSAYVRGPLRAVGVVANIGTPANPLGRIDVVNTNCGVGASFGASVCAGNDPIKVNTLQNNAINGSPVCATNQVTNISGLPGSAGSPAGPGAGGPAITGLTMPCTAPILDLPSFNKAGHTNFTNTAAPQNCPSGSCAYTLQKDTTYTGSIAVSNYTTTYTIMGDIYIKGNIGPANTGVGVSASIGQHFKVDDSVAKRPIIVVDGFINLSSSGIEANGAGISPIFVSFQSADSAKTSDPTYSARDPALAYDTLTTQSTRPAIYIQGGPLVPAGFYDYHASFYAYYGELNISVGSNVYGTLAGQRISFTTGSVQNVYLTADSWPR